MSSGAPKTMRVRASEAQAVEAFPGVHRRTLTWGERSMMSQTVVKAGRELPEHAHPHEQLTYIVKGRLELRVGDETFDLVEGDCIFVPGDRPHYAKALEDTVALDVFSPPREDFKQS